MPVKVTSSFTGGDTWTATYFNDHILEAMINSTSELNHLSPCRLEVVTDASSLKYVHTVSTHNCHYLRSLVQLRVSVLCLREDGQQWQWDPGGEDFDRLIKGDLLTVRNKTSGHVTNL